MNTAGKQGRFGWIPDLPDRRDFLYAVSPAILRALPHKADLRPECPPIYDQGKLGSCTANAIAAAIQFDLLKQKAESVFTPSRLFIYYNERAMEGTVDSDSGAQIRDGIKSVSAQGDCPEPEWPYDVSKFRKKPLKKCYDDAVKHKVVSYQRLTPLLDQLKGCLASGWPFVFGITVYESFESARVAKTGIAPMPSPKERSLGGHAIMAVGYDDAQRRFIIRNSWGLDWGLKGYFTLPFAYITNPGLADDFWTIRVVA